MKKHRKITLLLLAFSILILTMPISASAATVKLNKTKATMYVGQSGTLKVSGTKKTVKWASSNKKVVTVNSKGKVTAKKAGTAKIAAKIGKKKLVCKITVKKVVKVTKVKLNKTSATLKGKGATVALKATITPSKATNKAVTWKSSNTKVATVATNGKVTAVGNGTATITCTAKDGSKKKATCKVTVSGVKATATKTEPTPTFTEEYILKKIAEWRKLYPTGSDWGENTTGQVCGEFAEDMMNYIFGKTYADTHFYTTTDLSKARPGDCISFSYLTEIPALNVSKVTSHAMIITAVKRDSNGKTIAFTTASGNFGHASVRWNDEFQNANTFIHDTTENGNRSKVWFDTNRNNGLHCVKW